MNAISTYALNFSQRLVSGDFYKEPLSEQEKQGHAVVAAILEKAANNAEIMGQLAADFLTTAVQLNGALQGMLAPKDATPVNNDATTESVEDSSVDNSFIAEAHG